MSTMIESASLPLPLEIPELVLPQILRTLLSTAIRALSRGDPAHLAEVSHAINGIATDILATSPNGGCFPLTPDAQQQRQQVLDELRQQSSFCCAMLRRWRRSILLRRQLLDLATAPTIYTDSLDPRWRCHE